MTRCPKAFTDKVSKGYKAWEAEVILKGSTSEEEAARRKPTADEESETAEESDAMSLHDEEEPEDMDVSDENERINEKNQRNWRKWRNCDEKRKSRLWCKTSGTETEVMIQQYSSNVSVTDLLFCYSVYEQGINGAAEF